MADWGQGHAMGEADPGQCEPQGDNTQEPSWGSLRVHDAHEPDSQILDVPLKKIHYDSIFGANATQR